MKRIIIYSISILCLLTLSCKKDFLNAKPDQALVVPSSLANYQALLDNSNTVMNYVPALRVLAADDFVVEDNGFAATNIMERNSYLWADNLYEDKGVLDWNRSYQQVFYANIVLDGLMENTNLANNNQQKYNGVLGTALFLRAFSFYHLAQQFALPYVTQTASGVLGIPLRLSSDVNVKSERSNLQQTYERILTDLQQALNLLPDQVAHKTRPTKIACLAMLARVYQTMGNHQQARVFAQKVIDVNGALLDYNTLVATEPYPMPAALPNGNAEVLFYSVLNNISALSSTSTLHTVNQTLYQSYEPNDLRKALLFAERANGIAFKGSYTKTSVVFAGLSINEMYLICAESYARVGETVMALENLNHLLVNRYKKNLFVPLVAQSAEEALKLVLTERRKELVCRETRWTDLRRLNNDPRFATTINKMYLGSLYTLLPNSTKYVFSIPDDVITLTGMPQNLRK